jgi:hypothetical protein
MVTPKSSHARRAANGYGATAASSASSRAREPLTRPGSSPANPAEADFHHRKPGNGNAARGPGDARNAPTRKPRARPGRPWNVRNGTNRRFGASRLRRLVHSPLKLLQHPRTVFVFHRALHQKKLRRLIGQNRPHWRQGLLLRHETLLTKYVSRRQVLSWVTTARLSNQISRLVPEKN